MWVGLLGFIVATVIAAQANLVLTRYQIDVATTLLAYVALAQAWNILAGFSGQFSLGVSAFVGTGAYAAGLVQIHLGVDFLVAMVAAALFGGLLAALLAWPLLRLRGDYFSIGTLAAALALQAWMFNWTFAGGSTGIGLPFETVPGPVSVFRIACVVAGIAMATAFFVSRSNFGLRLKAVRDNEGAATSLGVSAFNHRLSALLINGVLSGLVGGLIAMQQVSFEPVGMLGIGWTINALLMTIVGGIGTLIGPPLGAVVVCSPNSWRATRASASSSREFCLSSSFASHPAVCGHCCWPVSSASLSYGTSSDQLRQAPTTRGAGTPTPATTRHHPTTPAPHARNAEAVDLRTLNHPAGPRLLNRARTQHQVRRHPRWRSPAGTRGPIGPQDHERTARSHGGPECLPP